MVFTGSGVRQRAAPDGGRFTGRADGRAMARRRRRFKRETGCPRMDDWVSCTRCNGLAHRPCGPQPVTDSHSVRLGPGWLSV